ncbi:MAG: glycosyltransferase family 4 protein [Thermodesulfobacteriota bacterium]
MKVAIVSDCLPGYHRMWSGAEIIAVTLADMLKSNGCEVSLVTAPFEAEPVDASSSVHQVWTPLKSLGTLSRNFPIDIGAIFSTYRVLKKLRPDIVHINAKYLFIPTLIACLRLKISTIFTVPDYFIFCPTTYIRKPDGSSCTTYHGPECYECMSVQGDGALKKAIGLIPKFLIQGLLTIRARVFDHFLKKVSAYVVLSESSKKRLVEYGIPKEKIRLIYHYKLATPRETKEEITNPSAVFVGWMSEENGTDILVRAFLMARKKVAGAKLYIVGTGKDDFEEGLKKEIAEAGLTGSVSFLGKKDNQEALSIISKCDVAVVPHQWPKEFGPVILVEALALGKPVITSKVGATGEYMVDGENGFLIEEYRSPEAFAEKLLILLSDTERARRMGAKQNDRIAFLTDDSSAIKATELYRSLI